MGPFKGIVDAAFEGDIRPEDVNAMHKALGLAAGGMKAGEVFQVNNLSEFTAIQYVIKTAVGADGLAPDRALILFPGIGAWIGSLARNAERAVELAQAAGYSRVGLSYNEVFPIVSVGHAESAEEVQANLVSQYRLERDAKVAADWADFDAKRAEHRKTPEYLERVAAYDDCHEKLVSRLGKIPPLDKDSPSVDSDHVFYARLGRWIWAAADPEVARDARAQSLCAALRRAGFTKLDGADSFGPADGSNGIALGRHCVGKALEMMEAGRGVDPSLAELLQKASDAIALGCVGRKLRERPTSRPDEAALQRIGKPTK